MMGEDIMTKETGEGKDRVTEETKDKSNRNIIEEENL